MYRGTNYPNCYRPYTPRNQHIRPQGHYFQGNINPYPSWQPRYSSNFQNVEYKYWCETCDKGFKLANHLDNHKLQHQKCNIDGCQYVAHPKVITRHIQMQHSTGLFKKISKLNNPEEIQKWREERKKKYPTKENIEKKKAEINEKIKRGEKMGMKREKGKNNNNNKGHTNKAQQPHLTKPKSNNLKRKLTSDIPQRQEQDSKICKIVPPIEETRKLKPFAGIQHLIDDDSEEVTEETYKTLSDDDDEFIGKNNEIKGNVPAIPICGALTSLLCEYGSSDEEEVQDSTNITSKETNIKSSDGTSINAKNSEKPPHIGKNTDAKSSIVENNHSKIDTSKINQVLSVTDIGKNNESDNDSGPEETTIVKDEHHIANDNTKTTDVPKNKKAIASKIHNSRQMNIIKKKRKLPSTLLEKLLHKEIQYERNIILQCIKHIVDNNFYDSNK